jgi:hypothetical protein
MPCLPLLHRRLPGFAIVAVLLLGASASAQTTGATLQGTITDPQKAILPGVAVVIANTETGLTRTVVTDERGWYRAPALPPGNYEIRAELSGFGSIVRQGLTLTIGQEATVNLQLELATVQESVTVSGQAPLVETSNSTLGTTVTRDELDSLPLAGRNFQNLAALSPGVAGVGSGSTGLNAGGQTTRSNSFIVDGASNDDTIVATQRGGFSLEAVREFAVLSNQFSAEYGMASGAIVTVLTRSGTNQTQGRGFLFHRDDSFDAQDPFSKAQGSGKSPFSQQRFGGFLGGPIVHDRMFYFGAYEGLRQRQTSVVTSPLVPASEREFAHPEDGHQYFAKADNRLSDAHALSVRYRADKRMEKGNGIGGLNTKDRGSNSNTLDQDVVMNETWVVSSRILNEFRFQFARRDNFIDTTGYSVDGTPQIDRPSGNFGKAQNLPQGRDENRYQVVNNYSISVGTHDLKFGGDVSLIRAESFFPRNRDGNFQFRTDAPFNADDPSTYPFQYSVAIIDPVQPLPNDLFSFFVQDSWRARSNLTFNVGVRYDRERGFHKIVGTPDDANNFQPRLGFVWDPFDTGKTAVRGGYGHYVDQSFLNIQLNVAAARRSVELVVQNPGYPDPFSRGNVANTPPSTADTTANPKTPETRTASLGFKRELFDGFAVSVDGVHSRGYNQYAWDDRNYPDPVTGVRPDPTKGRVIIYDNYGSSWYDALLFAVERRGRINWGANYTLSKTQRDVEGFQFTPQDMRNKGADKGYADNDRRHQFVANVTLPLPWGFQVGAVYQGRSALPFNVTTGTDNNRDTFIVDRPDFADPNGDPRSASTYTGAFTGRVGNVPRNYARGDAYHNVDVRLSKTMRFGNRRFEGFVESFNVANYAQFDRPTGNIRSSSFGRATRLLQNQGIPRQVELGFRFDF